MELHVLDFCMLDPPRASWEFDICTPSRVTSCSNSGRVARTSREPTLKTWVGREGGVGVMARVQFRCLIQIMEVS